MAAYIRLQESSSVVAEFAKAGAEQPKAPHKQRITAKNVFGKKESATRPGAMAMAKAKHDDS
jgi:hypothetical protein